MTRRRRALRLPYRPRPWRIVLGFLAVTLPAMADAPPLQYLGFDHDAVEITDRQTTLVWARSSVLKFTTPGDGRSFCDLTVFPKMNGRVPTVKELLTLVDEEPHVEYDSRYGPPFVQKSIDPLAFADSRTPTDKPYWTSTAAPGGKFWTVDFTTGKTEARTAPESLYVRCVR